MKTNIVNKTKWLSIVFNCIVIGAGLILNSCMKEFLEVKHNFSNVIPEKLEDYQAILDNNNLFNRNSSHNLGILGGDELYVRDIIFNSTSRNPIDKNIYTWNKEVFNMSAIPEWDYAYKRILHANIVLEGVGSINSKVEQLDLKNSILGTAYFARAFSYHQLCELFCVQYDPQTVENDLGIPLRLEADITKVEKRAPLARVYEQIISDLDKAVELLPTTTLVRERPNRAAALALMARVQLQKLDYEKAFHYADLSLLESNKLIDFKQLPLTGVPNSNGSYLTFDGLRQSNPEILFLNAALNSSIAQFFVGGDLTMDIDLMNSYEPGDLRKRAYFLTQNGVDAFIGTYTAEGSMFSGLAVDEVYLIKAEAACRTAKADIGLQALNHLLVHRYDNSFVPLRITEPDDILEKVIEERRKELVFRGVRWSDLRRLNREPRFAKTLRRQLNGETIELLPNSPRYVWPLPYLSILQSGLIDNPR